MSRNLILLCGLCAVSLLVSSTFRGHAGTFQVGRRLGDYRPLGGFAPTFYRILDERAPEWKDESRTEDLLTVNNDLIERVTPSFKRQLDIEGSARLRDGRIVNFHNKIDGNWRYMVASNAPFGLGIDGYKLVPYRTLAVDPHVIRTGTVLYLPVLNGVRLPSGEIHDGFMFAHDEGQGITGKRVDVFVGYESDVDNTLTRSGRIEDMRSVDLYEVDAETANQLNQKYREQFVR